jgi:hypothetical protein
MEIAVHNVPMTFPDLEVDPKWSSLSALVVLCSFVSDRQSKSRVFQPFETPFTAPKEWY